MLSSRSSLMPGNWRKSSHSGQQGDCIEVAGRDGRVLVRDTKRQDGPVLTFTAEGWRVFAGAVKQD